MAMSYFCSVSIYKLDLVKPSGLCYVCIMVVRLHYGYVRWVNHKRREYSIVCRHSCRATQERINMFAVPRTP